MDTPVSSLTRRFTVGEYDTAPAVGSGSLEVLGTPRMIAWMEAVTCEAVSPALADGETSVGSRIDIEHLAPSPVGQEVEVEASVAYVDGRLHRFTVAARNVTDSGPGTLVGAGEISRVVVDADRFMGRLAD